MNDNQPFLEQLYKEYKQLEARRSKVANLIIEYGGSIPNNFPPTTTVHATTTFPSSINNPLLFASDTFFYPGAGTWKDKIKYILLRFDTPGTVQEIVDRMIQYEGVDTDKEKLHTTITQYCSNMGKEGELGVEQGYRNKYYLIDV